MVDQPASAEDKAFIAAFVEAGKDGHVLPGYARAVGRTKIVPRGTAVAFTPQVPTKTKKRTTPTDSGE